MSDLAKLAADLHRAVEMVDHETKQVCSKGGLNIKTPWRAAWKGRDHTPGLYARISYDVKATAGGWAVEVGPTLGGVGSLGGVIEEGTVNNAPSPAGAIAQDAEIPRFEDALSKMAERLLDGR